MLLSGLGMGKAMSFDSLFRRLHIILVHDFSQNKSPGSAQNPENRGSDFLLSCKSMVLKVTGKTLTQLMAASQASR